MDIQEVEEPKVEQVDVSDVVKEYMKSQAKICDILLAIVNRLNELNKN